MCRYHTYCRKQHVHNLPSTDQTQEGNPWLVQMKRMNYWRQLTVLLHLLVIISSTVWSVHHYDAQEQKISEVQSQLAQQQAELCDGQCEGNATARISELEDNALRLRRRDENGHFQFDTFPIVKMDPLLTQLSF